jgi:hypothetical protein
LQTIKAIAAMATTCMLAITDLTACGPVYSARRSSLIANGSDADFGPKPTEAQIVKAKIQIFSYLRKTRGSSITMKSFTAEQANIEREAVQSYLGSPTAIPVWALTLLTSFH